MDPIPTPEPISLCQRKSMQLSPAPPPPGACGWPANQGCALTGRCCTPPPARRPDPERRCRAWREC
eukprot:5756242-Pyramimonas_sp.AAC.1